MKGSTGRSLVALDPERRRHVKAVGQKPWTLQRLRHESSYWRARTLSTAVHLGLFDWLGKEAKGSKAARSHFGGTVEGWEIFLNALSAMGLLQKRQKKFANSRFGLRHLCRGKGSFLLADHDAWDLWGKLADFLTTGKRPKISQPFFTDRNRTERLLQPLHEDALKIAPYIMERLPVSVSKTLLDVGGGLGSFALAFCRRFPHLQGTIVEHPKVVPLVRRAVKNASMTKRVRVSALDILKDPLPQGFDLVFISNVLHGQGARENRTLLKSAYRSLNQGGRIILRDVFMNRARTHPDWGALFSVSLLLHTPKGRCYALDEVRMWLRQAGFSNIEGPLRSSPLFFDPDSILIAEE
jgi:cyclopropane fatty-acyl-phospholipid synthase-like methyltransferase